MLPRRLTPVLVAAALAGLAGAGCAEQSAGVRVGDRTLSEADVIDELDAYGDNPALVGPDGEGNANLRGDLAGSYDQTFVSEILEQRIIFLLAERVFRNEGLELTDRDRAEAEGQLTQQLGPTIAEFPEKYRTAFVEDVARYNVLSSELGADGFRSALTEAATTSDIHVNSRFGRWDEDQLLVEPPEGPTPSASEGGGATGEAGEAGTPATTLPGG